MAKQTKSTTSGKSQEGSKDVKKIKKKAQVGGGTAESDTNAGEGAARGHATGG